MELLTKTHDTAIDFLKDEGKVLLIDVLDYLDEEDLYLFNKTNRGSEQIKVRSKELDWDEFYFEINAKISFNYEAYHRSSTMETPEEKEMYFSDIESNIDILVCQKWDEEDEEHKDYYPTATERKEIVKYLENHLELI
ncbi:hypothetical protein ACFFUE_07075 [Bergeyella porcorum]|uniref:hypothetical protein n=1 Tax=Bergeyella porcorum TaxID=1735111 RepID=UPI0035F09E1B